MTIRSGAAFRTLSLLSVVSLVAMGGCGSLRQKGGDDGDAAAAAVAEAVDAAPPPAAAPLAANVDDVARFPDEKPLENVAAVLQRTTNVREIPSVGKVVATLAKGAAVTEVAQRGTAFLVIVDSPKDQKKVMGWVGQESFTAAPPVAAGLKVVTCKAPEVPLVSDGPFCGLVCSSDSGCPTGQACKGVANKLTNAKLGDAVTLCTVVTPVVRPVAPVAANAGRAPVTPVAAPPSPAPTSDGRRPPVAPAEPATAPTSGLPPCPENPPPRTRRPGDGDGRPPPPTDCIQLPSRDRPNGTQCAGRNQCRSFFCDGRFCRGCSGNSGCDFDSSCSGGVCLPNTRDPEPESPSSGGGSSASKPASKPKGSERGRMCGKGSDCQSGNCKMENRTRGKCQ